MIRARSEYKKQVRNKKYQFDKKQTAKLEKLAKEYWKLLKDTCVKPKTKTPSSSKFSEYFKAIHDPNTPFFQPDEDILYYNDCYVKDEMKIMFNE